MQNKSIAVVSRNKRAGLLSYGAVMPEWQQVLKLNSNINLLKLRFRIVNCSTNTIKIKAAFATEEPLVKEPLSSEIGSKDEIIELGHKQFVHLKWPTNFLEYDAEIKPSGVLENYEIYVDGGETLFFKSDAEGCSFRLTGVEGAING